MRKPSKNTRNALRAVGILTAYAAVNIAALKLFDNYVEAQKTANEMGLVLSVLKRDHPEIFVEVLETSQRELMEHFAKLGLVASVAA